MPDPTVHVSFGREVLASLPEEVRDFILPGPYTFALFGPDVWFLHKPVGRHESRGRRMHTTKPGLFLMSLLRRPRSHMSLEHALDAAVMRRDGFWGQKHPVTDNYFPKLQLPEVMKDDLNAVFEAVYGWTGCWQDMNRACLRYRACFRIMENPRGFAARLTRMTKKTVLKSLMYSESFFHDRDPENEAHRVWRHPFDPTLTSSESFPELREKARRFAVSIITSAYRFLQYEEGTEESLAALIGDRSYLSGLPSDDPRNLTVLSQRPAFG